MDLCLLECFVTQSLYYLWGFPNPRIVEELPLITPSTDPSFSPNPLSSLAICSARVWRNLISPGLFQVLLNRPCSVCLMTCVPGVLRALLLPPRHHRSLPSVTLTPRRNHHIRWLFLGLSESLLQCDCLRHHLKYRKQVKVCMVPALAPDLISALRTDLCKSGSLVGSGNFYFYEQMLRGMPS